MANTDQRLSAGHPAVISLALELAHAMHADDWGEAQKCLAGAMDSPVHTHVQLIVRQLATERAALRLVYDAASGKDVAAMVALQQACEHPKSYEEFYTALVTVIQSRN